MSLMMMGGRRPRFVPPVAPASYAITGDWIADGNIVSPAGRAIPYKFFIPAGSSPSGQAKPLVVYNGGTESKGSDTSIMLLRGVGLAVNSNKATFPDYCLMLQIPAGADMPGYPNGLDWLIALNTLVLSLTAAYNIDATKRYYGGFSTGGIKTWDVAVKYPTLWAAIFPVAHTIRAGHLGTAANGIVPTDIATDNLTRDYVIDQIPTMGICMMVGDQDGLLVDSTGTRDEFIAHGYAVTTVTSTTPSYSTSTLRLLNIWPGYGHSDQMQCDAVALTNTAFWAWLHAQHR